MSTHAHSHAQAPAHAHAHQFEDIGQQREAVTLGMWIFLITEVMFFGGLFAGYTVYRELAHEAFRELVDPASRNAAEQPRHAMRSVLIFSAGPGAEGAREIRPALRPRSRQVLHVANRRVNAPAAARLRH